MQPGAWGQMAAVDVQSNIRLAGKLPPECDPSTPVGSQRDAGGFTIIEIVFPGGVLCLLLQETGVLFGRAVGRFCCCTGSL